MFDLIVIPCGYTKLDHPAPAGELYTGSYHRACRAAADALQPVTTLILSAKYGLLPLTRTVAPYDVRLLTANSATALGRTMLAEHLTSLGVFGILPSRHRPTTVAVLAGALYGMAIEAAFAGWPLETVKITRPLDGCCGIGEQMSRLGEIRRRGSL